MIELPYKSIKESKLTYRILFNVSLKGNYEKENCIH